MKSKTLIAFLLCLLPWLAQAITPAQIQQFKSLPRAQQEALARQYGVDLDALSVRAPTSQPSGESLRTPPPVVEDIEPKPEQLLQESNVKTEQSSAENEKKVTKLEPFGYDLFAGSPTTFAPVTEIPVPAEYIMGPGDEIRVQLWGKESSELTLTVNREGMINFPEVGPVSVNGLSFAELKIRIGELVKKHFIGLKASVSLGALRSIRVFVLGDVRQPGAYTVSSLSTITNALFVSGGVQKTGSLRHIQHKRQGELLGELDLYDMLLKGDTSNDARLQPGDVVFIPPVGALAGIKGEVRRPALYELKGNETVQDLIKLSGGFTADAYPKHAQLQRIDQNFELSLRDLNLTQSNDLSRSLKRGDILVVSSTTDLRDGFVSVTGEVVRPGKYGWQKGMRIADIVKSPLKDLTPQADLSYALLIRESEDLKSLTVTNFSMDKALKNSGSNHNIRLNSRDRIIVLNRATSETRTQQLNTAMAEIREQTGQLITVDVDPVATQAYVTLTGAVTRPGRYEWRPGLKISDIFESLDFDLLEKADRKYALLVQESEDRQRITVNNFIPEQVLAAPGSAADLVLNPRDALLVLTTASSEQRRQALDGIINRLSQQTLAGEWAPIASISGPIKFPGTYPLAENGSLRDILLAAGGLNENALLMEGEVLRYTLDENGRGESTLLAFAPDRVMQGQQDIALQGRDRILIKGVPEFTTQQKVTLRGEVVYPGDYYFVRGETLEDVIKRAGGLTDQAFLKGAIFTRAKLRALEAQRLAEAEDRLKREIVGVQLSGESVTGADAEKIDQAKDLLGEIQKSRAVGRMVIDLIATIEGDQASSVKLEDGDLLYVPPTSQAVSVFGEVQYPTSHLYENGLTVDDYLERSGGPTRQADEDRVYVVKADGSVVLPKETSWFVGNSAKLEPGDTIIVPLDLERLNQLELWTNVSQIIYQIALGAAAVGSL